MAAAERELGCVTADLVVLTVLPEEYAAVLACVRDPELARGTAATPNTYAWRLGTIAASHYGASFKVAVGIGTPTTTFGALGASQAISLFDPRYIAFVGVAGGFARDGQRHGDVAVSSVVTAYEYGKVDTGGFEPRGNFTYRCNDALVRAADVVEATGARWWHDADNPGSPPRVRTGLIASGDKVIDDPDEAFFAAVRAAWPKLLAVEMEGAGVAAAVHEVQGQRAVGFILVRGISDMPHHKAPGERDAASASTSTQERDSWKVRASRNAARFFSHLVATAWPVPPRSDSKPTPTQSYPDAEVPALSDRLEDARARGRSPRETGMFGLQFISGAYQGAEVRLSPSGTTRVGRMSGLEIVIIENLISRLHATIAVSGSAFVISDENSTTGTFVNGARVTSLSRLNVGDRILVGTSIARLTRITGLGLSLEEARSVFEARQRTVGTTISCHRGCPPRSGLLEDLPIGDLVRVLSLSGVTGSLVIEAAPRRGIIYFAEGELVGAIVEDKDEGYPLMGQAALFQIFAWQAGVFQVFLRAMHHVIYGRLQGTTEELLTEGLGRGLPNIS